MLRAHTLRRAKAQGAHKSILFTDHLAAIKAYQAVGFQQMGHYRLALLDQTITFRKS